MTKDAQRGQPVLVESRRIWSKAPHNAFTDLLRYRDRWYCVFREGKAHVSPDGALRVITSKDGEKWEPIALIKSPKYDLRDAKITVTPDGRLMLSGAGMIADACAGPVTFAMHRWCGNWPQFSDNSAFSRREDETFP